VRKVVAVNYLVLFTVLLVLNLLAKKTSWIVKKESSSCKSCVFRKKGNLAGRNGKAAEQMFSRFFCG
jgi:hypothetical protein